MSLINKYIPLPLAILSLILPSCSFLPSSIPIDEADVFVAAAFKEAMAEVGKVQTRPSKVSFSFYADEEVNAIIKQRNKAPGNNTLTLHSSNENTQIIKYTIKCALTKKVTYIDCEEVDSPEYTLDNPRPQLNFSKIQLRKNSRLDISILTPSGTNQSIFNDTKYNLQCSKRSRSKYTKCIHLPGTSLTTNLSDEMIYSISQVTLSRRKKQFEVIVTQTPKQNWQLDQRAKAYKSVQQWGEQYIDPKPITFKLVMLRDNSLLLSADRESLTSDLKYTLGKNYIDHDDYVLTPGQFKYINFERLDPDTRYIGVIANYRDDTLSTWKKVIKVEPTGAIYPLLVHLKRNEVDILTED